MKEINTGKEKMNITVDDLVRLARRDNNSIRPYLYVNPKQGKHIPSDPRETLRICEALANKVNTAYPDDKLYVIGFAETATGVASAISYYLKNIKYYQNTTREYKEEESYLYFTESHSHAKDQMLRSSGLEECIENVDRIIFVDDEVTTGNTIYKLVQSIKKNYNTKNIHFSIVSMLNSMPSERINELAAEDIDCLFLASIPFEYKKDEIINVSIKQENHHEYSHDQVEENESVALADEICYESQFNPRCVVDFSDYQKENQKFADSVITKLKKNHYNKFLVLGTEEFMYATIFVGKMLEDSGVADQVKIHSTTRSPIVANDAQEYPLKERYQIRSFYDLDRKTYIYNLEAYDGVLILTDAENYNPGLADLCSVLDDVGNKDIILGRWRYKEV